MIPKSWRITLFNWLGAGKITLAQDKTQEYNPLSTYTTGGGQFGLSIAPNGYGGPSTSMPATGQTMSIKITPANGGTIIQVNTQEYSIGELYIIPDGSDFDRELGKIITMSKLKA